MGLSADWSLSRRMSGDVNSQKLAHPSLAADPQSLIFASMLDEGVIVFQLSREGIKKGNRIDYDAEWELSPGVQRRSVARGGGVSLNSIQRPGACVESSSSSGAGIQFGLPNQEYCQATETF
jgi:hypothetical protein